MALGKPPSDVARSTKHPRLAGRERESPLNRFEKILDFKGEARVRYGDGEFHVLSPGDFVRCAVTGAVIPVAQLKYWSVDLQEPYASAEASLQRVLQQRGSRHSR